MMIILAITGPGTFGFVSPQSRAANRVAGSRRSAPSRKLDILVLPEIDTSSLSVDALHGVDISMVISSTQNWGDVSPLSPFALGLGTGVGFVLGLLGGGGSILALPCFLYVFKEPTEVAVAESLVVVCIGALTGFIAKTVWLDQNKGMFSTVDLNVAGPFAAMSAASSFVTARLVASYIPENVRIGLFVCFAVVSAVGMWPSAEISSNNKPVLSLPANETAVEKVSGEARGMIPIELLAVGIGALTAVIGAGGGFVVVPALTIAGGVPVKKSVASALIVVATNALVAFVAYVNVVAIHWGIVGPFAAAVAFGAVTGSAASNQVNCFCICHGPPPSLPSE